MKKNVKKKSLILVILLISILFILILLLVLNKNKTQIISSDSKEYAFVTTGNTIIDYQTKTMNDGKIEMLFILENEQTIGKITEVESGFQINSKEKNKIGFNRIIEQDGIYQFKLKEKGMETEELYTYIGKPTIQKTVTNEDTLGDGTTQTLKIHFLDNDNITNYYSIDEGENWHEYIGEIDIPKKERYNLMVKFEWKEGITLNKPIYVYRENIYVTYNETTKSRNIEIDYVQDNIEGTANYYKIGETRSWQQYTGPVTLADSSIDLRDIKTGTNKLVIYAKQVVNGEEIFTTSHEEEITTTVKLDVFNDVTLSGKTLAQYGFTASWVNKEDGYWAFALRDFKAGHGTNSANWSGTFNWTKAKTYGATSLYADIYQAGRSSAWAQSKITVVYTDGTTSVKQNTRTTKNSNYVHFPTTVQIDNTKTVNYIQFYLWGRDENYYHSVARLTSIILRGITLPVTE